MVSLFLTFDLAFAPVASFALQAPPSAPPPAGSASGERPVDLWAFRGQFVEVFDGTKAPETTQAPVSTYPLDRAALKRAPLTYGKLTAKIDPFDGHLIIEATRGENDKGEHGLLVARMHLPSVRGIKAIAQDAEILSMIDGEGWVHLVDWGWIETTKLVAPAQVHRQVWQSTTTGAFPTRAKFEMNYLTRGTRTLDARNLYSPDITYPADADGHPIHRPGDLIIKADGKLFAVLNRKNFHEKIQLDQAVLYSIREWFEDDPRRMKELGEFLKTADRDFEGFVERLKNVEELSLDPYFAKVLLAVGPKVLGRLRERVRDHAGYRQRAGDAMSAADHDLFFRDIEANALAMGRADEAYMQAHWPRLVTRRYQSRAQQDSVVNEDPSVQRRRQAKYYAKMGGVAALIVGVMALPQAYEHFEALQRYESLTWVYENAVPPVLKDAAYRWPLIGHVVSMTALWPLAEMISLSVGKGLKSLGARMQNTGGVFSGRVRDFARTWGDLELWQRIVAVGLRAYSFLILSPLMQLTEQMMQQRALIPALSLGINPAEVITPDSAIGQKLGLREEMTVGFMKSSRRKPTIRDLISAITLGAVPLAPAAQAEIQNSHALKMSALSEIYQQKKRRHNYSRILADLVVAEHYKIDPAVLREAERKKGFNLSDLRFLAENADARRMRELVDAELRRRIAEVPALVKVDEGIIDAEEFYNHVEIAREAALRISRMGRGQKYVREMWLKARVNSLVAFEFLLNLGRDTSELLYNTMPNRQAYSSTQREFVVDHLNVVYLTALFRDRANPKMPDQLAADPQGVFWTRGVALQDIISNISSHFFRAGALFVLQFQTAKAVTESLYEPIDKVLNRVLSRNSEGALREGVPGLDQGEKAPYSGYLKEQGFFPGIGQYALQLANMTESDIGGVGVRYVRRSLDVIFGYFYFGMFFRMALGHQGLGASMFGLSTQWLLWPSYVAVWWWFLQKGTNMYDDAFEGEGGKQDEFLNARNYLAQAGRATDASERETLLKKGVWDLFVMYDEGAPDLIDREFHPITTTRSLEEQAAFWSELARTKSPGAMVKNGKIPWLATVIAGFGSTYTSIDPLVWSTRPDMQNWSMLFSSALHLALFLPAFYLVFSKKTWGEWLPKAYRAFVRKTSGCAAEFAT